MNNNTYMCILLPSDLAVGDVGLLPMEKVKLVWRGDDLASLRAPFQLQDRWRSNSHLPSTINFRFTCRYVHTFSVEGQTLHFFLCTGTNTLACHCLKP